MKFENMDKTDGVIERRVANIWLAIVFYLCLSAVLVFIFFPF